MKPFLPRRATFRAAVLVLVALALAFPAAAVNVTVDTTQPVSTVHARDFGLNAVMWDPDLSTAQTISLLQAAGTQVIRIPGGSLSDTYNWSLNKSYSSPGVFNSWHWMSGMDSFAKLIEGLNCQVFVTVNYGSGTPQEAAAWVAYCNASATLQGTSADVNLGVDSNGIDWKTAGYWSAMRAATPLATDDGYNFLRLGRSQPFGFKYWEVGNEVYGSWETDYHTDPHDPYTYATQFQQYMEMMKSVDPTIKVGAVITTGEDSYANYTNHTATNPRTDQTHNGWTPVMLSTLNSLGVTPDFAVFHLYAQQPGQESDATLLQAASVWSSDATELRQQLDDYLGAAGANVELDVTENNSVSSNPGKQTTSLVNGLYLADSFGNLIQTQFHSLVWWALRNGPPTDSSGNLAGNQSPSLYGWRQFGDYGVLSMPSTLTGETTYYDAYPTYYIQKLLSHFARGGDTVIHATSDNTLLSAYAVKRTDGTLGLLILNKSPTETLNANITLTGFNPQATATVYSYGMPQDNAAETGTGSTDVATSSLNGVAMSFTTNFAPYSATVLSLAPAIPDQIPSISQQPVNQTVDAGSAASFTTAVSGVPAPNLRWQVSADGGSTWSNLADGGSRPTYGGTGTGTLTITGVMSAMDGYRYRCVATNSAGSVPSDPALLTVRALPTGFSGGGQSNLMFQNAVTGDCSVWLTGGTAQGSTATLGAVPGEWQLATTGDFNGDGQPDLVFENTFTGARVVWLMDGTSYVGSAVLGMAPTNWVIAGAADFNGDGHTDLLFQDTTIGTCAVWLMDGTTYLGSVSLGSVSPDWELMGAADFNGDGHPDLLFQNKVTGLCAVWLMDGTHYAGSASLGSVPPEWELMGTTDYNGDGHPDLLFENTVTGACAVWLMDETTYTGSVSLGTVPTAWRMVGHGGSRGRWLQSTAPDDFNADGTTDLVWHNDSTGELRLWLMGPGGVSSTVTLGSVSTDWQVVATGDYSGDGQPDILWRNRSTGDCALWQTSGTSYTGSIALSTLSSDWTYAGQADFNADGATDILWHNNSTGELRLWLMGPAGVASTVSLGSVSTDWQAVAAGKYTGAGQTDILWRNRSTGDCALWQMSGTSYAGSIALGKLSSDWTYVGQADFNAGGVTDILWHNNSTGELRLWLMDSGGVSDTVSLGTVPTNWQVVAAGDYTGAGQPDVIWRDSTTGDCALWQMSGTSYAGSIALNALSSDWSISR